MIIHKIKCVLKKTEFALIEGKQYSCGVQTRTLDLVVSQLTPGAVLAVLRGIGFSEWELVEWWEMVEVELEPNF